MAAKKSIAPILILGGLGVAGYVAYKHGMFEKFMHKKVEQGTASLQFGLKGFHAESDGSVHADIEAINPNSVPFRIQSIVGQILVAGTPAGTIKMFGDQVLRPNDQNTLSVAVKVLPNAVAMFRRKGQNVRFNGEININNNLLPFTMNYQL